MLKITPAQVQRMLDADESTLLMALERLVRAEHGGVVQGVPTDLVQRMVRTAMDTAHGLGFKRAVDVAAVTLLMFEFGPGFHRHPAVRGVLTDTRLAPAERLAAVCRDTPNAVWREIESTLHRQTWFPRVADTA